MEVHVPEDYMIRDMGQCKMTITELTRLLKVKPKQFFTMFVWGRTQKFLWPASTQYVQYDEKTNSPAKPGNVHIRFWSALVYKHGRNFFLLGPFTSVDVRDPDALQKMIDVLKRELAKGQPNINLDCDGDTLRFRILKRAKKRKNVYGFPLGKYVFQRQGSKRVYALKEAYYGNGNGS